MNITLVAEYLGVARSLDLHGANFGRANALGLQCMMELPIELWERVIVALHDNDALMALILDLRRTEGFDPAKHFVWHAPGIARK